jgi:stage V sporulation protein B
MSLKLSAYALRVLAPGLFIVAVMGVIRGFFQGMGTMVPTAASQIIEQIVNAIVSIIGASYLIQMAKEIKETAANPSLPFAYGAAGGTLGTVSGALIGLVFLLILFKVYYPSMKRKVARDKGHDLEGYGQIYQVLFLTIAPVILSTAIYNISETLDQGIFSNIMISQGHSDKETAELLGMFTGKYNTLINIPLAVANALSASLIPSLTATVASGTKKQVNEKINMVIRFSMVIAIPCAVGFLVMGEPILDLLYSGNIAIPAKMLQLGAITVVFYCLSTVTNGILQGVNKMTTPVKHGAISLVLHLIALFIMLVVFKWGIYAVVAGNIVFSFCMCILNSCALKRATKYTQEIQKTFIVPIEAAAIMGVITFAAFFGMNALLPKAIATLVALVIAIAVYGVALIKLGALFPDEVKALPKGHKIYSLFVKLHLMKAE